LIYFEIEIEIAIEVDQEFPSERQIRCFSKTSFLNNKLLKTYRRQASCAPRLKTAPEVSA
jgi:hypothetical protein